jgi:single-strand DNA-binding protein
MASLNKVFLMGNLTRDPEVRYIPSGTAVADLSLAINERFKDRDTGEWREKPVFVDVTVWRRQAETCAEYLSKGSPVMIEGRLQLDQWESNEGQKRSKLKVLADRVQFLSATQGRSGGHSGGGGHYNSSEPQEQQHSGGMHNEPIEHDDDDLPF